MLPVFINILATIACFLTVLVANIARGEQLPIVLVNGIMASDKDMKPLEDQILKALPGTYVKSIHILRGKWTSWMNMHEQGKDLCHDIQADPKLKNGFIMIAHSQGGLLARYYVERWNNPKCEILITLGSPHQGVFGIPGTYDERFKFLNHFENLARFMMYRSFAQKHLSIAQYWHDSIKFNLYLKRCTFLPYLNNEIEHEFSEHYKANMLSLKHFVMINSPFETIVEPACSCHFGFYKNGSKDVEESFVESRQYINDLLGLRTLDISGRLHLLWANCTHTDYQEDIDCFERLILPFLKGKAPKKDGYMVLDEYDYDYEF
jgi:palmitoyl-protein thioesterase